MVGEGKAFKNHFGIDGLGDVLPDRDSDNWKTQIKKEHAVNALIRLVKEHPGKVGKMNSKYCNILISSEVSICGGN